MNVETGIDTSPPSDRGDFLIDFTQYYVGIGLVTIPAGLDGAYHVFVYGTQGHIDWP